MQVITPADAPAPLTTCKMGNLQAAAGAHPLSGYKVGQPWMIADLSLD
jgi:hypothetical protein